MYLCAQADLSAVTQKLVLLFCELLYLYKAKGANFSTPARAGGSLCISLCMLQLFICQEIDFGCELMCLPTGFMYH
jgi:hypothetical protein